MNADPKLEVGFSRLLRRSELYSVALIGITILVFLFAAWTTNTKDLFDSLERVGPWTAASVALLALGNYALRLMRFRYLLGRKGLRVPLAMLAQIYVAGFAMTATPGKIGEFVRMWFLKRQCGLKYRDTLPVSVADRADDVFANAILCVLTAGTFLDYLLPTAIIAILMATTCVVLVRAELLAAVINALYAIVRRKPRIFARLRQLAKSTSELFQSGPLTIGIVLGCVGWFFEGFALFLCTSVFAHISLGQAVFIFTFASLVGALTFLPGGVGGVEISMVTLLTTLNLSFQEATAITVVVRIGTLWFGIGCGYLALFSWLRRRRLETAPVKLEKMVLR
jgi:uncharacterized protein (TIRG00374 family)